MPAWALRAVVLGVALDLAALALASAALALHAVPRAVPPAIVIFAVGARYWMIGPPLLLAALGLLVAGFRRAPLSKVAREADTLLDLRERLSTALELEDLSTQMPQNQTPRDQSPRSAASATLTLRQRADAVDALRRHEPTEAYPVRLGRRDIIAASLACAVLLALVLAPDVTGRSDRQLAEIAARAEADQLSTLADQIANDPSLSAVERAALSAALAQAAQSLNANPSDSQSALSALASGEQSLAQQANATTDNSQLALSRVSDALDQAAASKAVSSKIDNGDYAGAAQALSQLGNQVGSLSQSDRAALADALSKAASSTSQIDPQLSGKLAKAASSLGQGSQSASGGPQSAFSQAGDALKQAGQTAAGQAALDQALAALEGAKAQIGSAQSGADSSRAEAGSAGGASPDPSQTAGAAGSQPSGQDGAGGSPGDAASGQTGGLSGQNASGSTAAGGAGKGTLAKQGQNPAEDFASRVVKVPTNQFGDPSVSASQASNEGPIGQATVDYRQVLANYQKRATDAMSQSSIPASLKDLVSAYFTSLDSGRATSSGSGK